MTLDELATLACKRLTKRGEKRAMCPCEPCAARRELFGLNLNVVDQESWRTAKEAGGNG